MLTPAREETEDVETESVTKGETTPEKKEESKGMVVYCMDISGSMSASVRLPELQGNVTGGFRFTLVHPSTCPSI